MYTGSETYMDERTVPMNNAPTVLSTGNNAGIVDNQEWENKSRQKYMGEWGRMGISTPQVAATSSFCGGTILSEALHSLWCFPVIFYGCRNAGPEQSDSQDEDALMRSLFHAPLPVGAWREYCAVLWHFTVISLRVRSLEPYLIMDYIHPTI